MPSDRCAGAVRRCHPPWCFCTLLRRTAATFCQWCQQRSGGLSPAGAWLGRGLARWDRLSIIHGLSPSPRRFMHPELQEAVDLHHAIVAEAGNALVGYATEKALANVVLLSEIPTTYDKDQNRQVNAGNLLLRGVPGVGKTFFGVILAAISNAKFARIQGRADLQPTEIVGFQMINPATGEFMTEFGPLASGRGDPARRDQPHPAQVAERVPRGAAGPHGDRGQGHLRAAAFQLRHRDDEPGGARAGHVSAVRGGRRSLCHPRQRAVSRAGRRGAPRQLRLQARQPQAARCPRNGSSSCGA